MARARTTLAYGSFFFDEVVNKESPSDLQGMTFEAALKWILDTPTANVKSMRSSKDPQFQVAEEFGWKDQFYPINIEFFPLFASVK